jgi:hypothetical protein
MFLRNMVYPPEFHPIPPCLELASLRILQCIPKLGYHIFQTADIMIEVMGEKELLREIIHSFAKPLQVLECLPIKLNLLTLVAQLPRELLDAGRQVQGRILLCKLEPLSREFEY